MPFELGVDFGCRHYGGKLFSGKVILILEEKPYRYQAAISDLAGNDIAAHGGNYRIAVRKVRNWIYGLGLPYLKCVQAASSILAEYEDFQEWYYKRRRKDGASEQDIQDYSTRELLDEMHNWRE